MEGILMEQNQTRLIKVVKINPYLNNIADFNWSVYFTSFVFVGITIFSSLLFAIYFSESLDYLKALDQSQDALIVVAKYFISHMLGALNNFNHLNDFIGEDIFNFNIELESPQISFAGWVLIGISGVLAFLFHSMSLYQYYAQRIIKTSGFFNYYVPYILLHKFWIRHETKKLYIRILPLVKLEKISKIDFDLIIQNFFDIPFENIENYEIKIESKRKLLWFDYTVLHLVAKENKKEVKENESKKTISKQQQPAKQDRKISNNNGELKGFFE